MTRIAATANARLNYYKHQLHSFSLDQGLFIAGANTNPNAMPTAGTGSYALTAEAGVIETVVATKAIDAYSLSGTGTLNADFNNSTISGVVTYTSASGTTQFTNVSPIATVTIPTTNIVGNTFGTNGATITYNQASTPITTTASAVTGGFYGPAAEDVAGVMGLEAQSADGTQTLIASGGFVGSK